MFLPFLWIGISCRRRSPSHCQLFLFNNNSSKQTLIHMSQTSNLETVQHNRALFSRFHSRLLFDLLLYTVRMLRAGLVIPWRQSLPVNFHLECADTMNWVGDGENRHFPRIVRYASAGLAVCAIGRRNVRCDWVYGENLVHALMLCARMLGVSTSDLTPRYFFIRISFFDTKLLIPFLTGGHVVMLKVPELRAYCNQANSAPLLGGKRCHLHLN